MATLTVPMPTLRLTIRSPRALGIRIWLAAQCFRLGGAIMGSAVEIETKA
jgi:hypothetical protein